MKELAPAYLFIGQQAMLKRECFSFLKKQFCTSKGCNSCTTCTQIDQRQYHGSLWIEPEKRYSLSDLEIIFKRTTLALDGQQQCFFVITKADFLNASCANALLKLVEEPPPGYHFLFLAERLALVLPTIRSRCTQKLLTQKTDVQEILPLVRHFMRLNPDPVALTAELSTCTMTEQECMTHVDELLSYWVIAYKEAVIAGSAQQKLSALRMTNLFKEALKKPPATGSAKIFWKNIFLQLSLLG